MKQKQELTKAELEIMQILWSEGKAFVNRIIERMDAPKPAYNTVSTIVRILEKKGFVSHLSYGRSHEYYPLVSKEEYTSGFMKNVLTNFFGNSVSNMVSFFSERENLSVTEMEEILELLQEKKQTNK